MKATLKFNLLDVDDRQAHLRCVKANDMTSVLWKFTRNSRKTIEQEFENQEQTFDAFDGIERCFEHFYKLLEENSINVDELYE